jgi:hypothetical protein
VKKRCLLLLVAGLTSGCGNFRQPPLPQRGAATTAPTTGAEAAWAARLRGADAVYFSLTKIVSPNDAAAWQIAAQMQRSGAPLALGWAEIPVEEQPFFDQWQRGEISAIDLLNRIVRPVPVALLERGLRPDLAQAALGCSRSLLDKIRRGETLSPQDRPLLPGGFEPRADGFENFAERATSSPRLRRYDVRRLFRAHLVAEETIAENIVRFRAAKPTTKLLIFLPNDIMIDPREVAAFVAQKLPLHQLILDRERPLEETRPELLAGAGRRGCEVVDRAPRTALHNRGRAAPRLRA